MRIFATMGGGVLALDFATKWIVQETFFLGQSRPVLGSFFRLTYIINPGAAFGFQVGGHSRLVFTILGAGVLLLLFTLYRWTPPHDRFRLGVIAVVCGGALGNLLDRLAHPFGVVDFFDVGIGRARLPIFNIADVAISVGALLLAASFWREGHEDEKEKAKRKREWERNDAQEGGMGAGGDI
ncbi:MAG: signal peptidase II [Gemmatimonadota bacterium]